MIGADLDATERRAGGGGEVDVGKRDGGVGDARGGTGGEGYRVGHDRDARRVRHGRRNAEGVLRVGGQRRGGLEDDRVATAAGVDDRGDQRMVGGAVKLDVGGVDGGGVQSGVGEIKVGGNRSVERHIAVPGAGVGADNRWMIGDSSTRIDFEMGERDGNARQIILIARDDAGAAGGIEEDRGFRAGERDRLRHGDPRTAVDRVGAGDGPEHLRRR